MGRIAIFIIVVIAMLLLVDELFGNRYISQLIKQVI